MLFNLRSALGDFSCVSTWSVVITSLLFVFLNVGGFGTVPCRLCPRSCHLVFSAVSIVYIRCVLLFFISETLPKRFLYRWCYRSVSSELRVWAYVWLYPLRCFECCTGAIWLTVQVISSSHFRYIATVERFIFAKTLRWLVIVLVARFWLTVRFLM